MRLFWSLFLYVLGWKQKNAFPHHIKRCVAIVGPHTSSWDFVIGIAFRSKLKLTHAKYLGKAELFKGPFGFIFRKLGGYPVERSAQHHMVDQAAALFNGQETFRLVLSPEGTRKKVERLKTGFYHIAKKAGVPILMVGMDFAKKELSISAPFFPGGDESADFRKIHEFFAPIQGKIPEQGLSHLLETTH